MVPVLLIKEEYYTYYISHRCHNGRQKKHRENKTEQHDSPAPAPPQKKSYNLFVPEG